MEGLSSDGGLYIPKEIPSLTLGQWYRLMEYANDYKELALR
jgi:hypothetical protein